MYIQTTVINRKLINESVGSFRSGVIDLALEFLLTHDGDPFNDSTDHHHKNKERFIDKIRNLNFDEDISFELTRDDCSFSIYKSSDYERCHVWSDRGCTFDGVVEWVDECSE